MEKSAYLPYFIIITNLFFLITNCDINHLYNKSEYMKLGEDSKSSRKSENNTSEMKSDVKEAQLVAPATEYYGLYTFSTVSIRKSNGELMYDGIDFDYDQSLNAIYNNTDSGALSSGYFRVVHNGINVKTGISLTPLAKDLTTPVSPPSNQVYIDPKKGKFVLPRPFLWIKGENNNEVFNSLTIGDKIPALHTAFGISQLNIDTGKFDNCMYFRSISSGGHVDYCPRGDEGTSIPKGTLSIWIDQGSNWYEIDIYIDFLRINALREGNYRRIRIYTNGVKQVEIEDNFSTGNFIHLYIVWDDDGNLDGGKTVRVYKAGTEIMSTTALVTANGAMPITIKSNYRGLDNSVKIDNLKIWNHVVSEDPSFEYNNGDGREDALHFIYGEVNNYKPNIKVGYFYK